MQLFLGRMIFWEHLRGFVDLAAERLQALAVAFQGAAQVLQHVGEVPDELLVHVAFPHAHGDREIALAQASDRGGEDAQGARDAVRPDQGDKAAG